MWEGRWPGGMGQMRFSHHCGGNEGSGFTRTEGGGSNEKRIFHGSENSSTAVAQLELLPTAPRLSGIFVSLGNTETCSTLSLPLPLAPVTLTHPFAPRVHLVRSLPSIWLLRQLLSCVPKPFLPLWVKPGSLRVPRPQTGAAAHKKKLR